MSAVDSQSLEIWVQSGIPENGELVFNVHFRNSKNTEWEVWPESVQHYIDLLIYNEYCNYRSVMPYLNSVHST